MLKVKQIRKIHKAKYDKLDYIKFKPINRFMQAGNEIQICCTKLKGIGITERTFFPYNFMKNIITWYILDLILPIDYPITNGNLSTDYYTDKGYGMPEFNTLEDACEFIKNYKRN